MGKKEPMFEYLESIAETIPVPYWWLDLDGRWLGLNTVTMARIGVTNKIDVIRILGIDSKKLIMK